ncbi:hypothetical protein RRG08_005406 [Elysia crispata]|uniref:Uncharacterized protein n=1 Tax=Elysia crispata TaxID=231223 RepID=A0AAE0Y0S2_9GAST|nr:hypothetical protein RRG08_005406 [Elysia crispata]
MYVQVPASRPLVLARGHNTAMQSYGCDASSSEWVQLRCTVDFSVCLAVADLPGHMSGSRCQMIIHCVRLETRKRCTKLGFKENLMQFRVTFIGYSSKKKIQRFATCHLAVQIVRQVLLHYLENEQEVALSRTSRRSYSSSGSKYM